MVLNRGARENIGSRNLRNIYAFIKNTFRRKHLQVTTLKRLQNTLGKITGGVYSAVSSWKRTPASRSI